MLIKSPSTPSLKLDTAVPLPSLVSVKLTIGLNSALIETGSLPITNWLFVISTLPDNTTHLINLHPWFGVAVKVTFVPSNASIISALAVPYWLVDTEMPLSCSNTA